MKDFQAVLQECLKDIESGAASVNECLARYPEHADRLKPLLHTAQFLVRGRSVKPSPTFNSYTRAAVIRHARAHARKSRAGLPIFQRAALTISVLIAALLVTGTVNAQSALPGEADYPIKRVSEQVWRALALDTVEVDITIAGRRLHEWIAVAGNPQLSARAMNDYFEALTPLESVQDVRTLRQILPKLRAQQEMLEQAGLPTRHLDTYIAETSRTISAVVFLLPSPTAFTLRPTPTSRTFAKPPPFSTSIPPTKTPVPTQVTPTATEIPPTFTPLPTQTATAIPPSETPTSIPPTATPVTPPATATATNVPPSPTEVQPTNTSAPSPVPTATESPPTDSAPTDSIIP